MASAAVTWALVRVGTALWPGLGDALAVWLTSTTIACKGLYQAGQSVLDPLKQQDLKRARQATSMIVGRDTDNLSESEVVRATVETLAENLVDGVVAPVFYAVLGGAPLAMAYRSINTLDSMVGYKNPLYQDFGWASARLDDLANYIPARITAVLLFLVMAGLRLFPFRAWQTMRHDASKHPSPNAGIPESMMAGGLGVQLGGTNLYAGRASHRALMGEPLHRLSVDHINQAMQVVIGTGALLLVLLGIGWVASL
jgi:adenosylcobinamide-phosphate synthase